MQARMDMTEEQRKTASPESTQDIKNADAIVVFDDGTAMAYKPDIQKREDIVLQRADGKKIQVQYYPQSKRNIVPYIPELLEKAQFTKEDSYTPQTESNIIAYWKSDVPIRIDNDKFDVHLTVKEDNNGNLFWDAQVKEKTPRTTPATNPGDKGLSSEISEDTLNITPSAEDVNENNTFYQSAFHGTPHPELEGGHFSLEKVGSGEGGAAHGYGAVYAALKYDVAEGYRKRLVRRERESVFPDSPEELAITTYLKNNQNKDAAIKELQQIEKAEYKKFGTKDENVLAYANASQAQDYLRYVEESNLEKQIAEVENSKGQTYEVDIPENPYLMDEDEEFVRQPEIVRNALREIVNELTDEQISKEFAGTTYPENRDALRRMWEDGDYDFNNDGRGIYRSLTTMLGSKKAASQMLEKHGVKGITYEGAQDGRCFVIFNPKDVKVIQKFYQQEANRSNSFLGAYSNRIIYLNKNANASTLPHELAHFWSDELKQSKSLRAMELLKQADQWEEKEFERKYQVVKQGDKYIVADKAGKSVYDNQGNGFATEEKAKAYAKEELFAQGFEQYLRSGGKAPSKYRI